MHNFLPQEKFSSLYSVNELLSEHFTNIFRRSISLHISFSYILVDSTTQMPIRYRIVPLTLYFHVFMLCF
jgi:hypothetical protein